MNKKKAFIIGGIVLVLLVIALIFIFYPRTQVTRSESFGLNYAILKSVIKQGESSSLDLKITSKEKDNFRINLDGLDNLAYLNEKSFEVDKSKLVRISFNGGSSPGVYVGGLYIESSSSNKTIPVILEIQSQEVYFALSLDVAPKYREILKGGEVLGEVKIFNLKNKETNSVNLEYSIKNLAGESIKTESETITVGSSLDFIKTMHLPADIDLGTYVFSITLKNGDYVATSSALLEIVNVKKSFFQRYDLFSILVMVFLLAIIIVVIYILRERNKLFLSLEKQHESQINSISRNIETQKHKSLDKVKTDKEKRKIIIKFESAKKKILEKIKKEQAKQKKELEELKKKGNQKIIDKKMHEWKGESYSKAVKSANIDSGLKKKLEALETARVEGLISSKSYMKGKQRIARRLR